jgi:uncharacterized membrane protein YdfJ with MMPL/SSD domain
MRINPESLARASSRHPWRVIGIWGVLFFVMVGLCVTLLGDVLNNDISFTNRPESIKAQEVIDEQFTAAQQGASTEFVIVHSESLTVDDPAFKEYVQQIQGALAAGQRPGRRARRRRTTTRSRRSPTRRRGSSRRISTTP